jgi:hypothetical protein
MDVKTLFQKKPVLMLAILSLVLFVFNIGSCISSHGQNVELKKEMAQRLDTEERMTRANQEKAALLEKLKIKEKESEEDKDALQATRKALTQEQLVCRNLQDELSKVNKLKEALEDNLKKALADNKKARR